MLWRSIMLLSTAKIYVYHKTKDNIAKHLPRHNLTPNPKLTYLLNRKSNNRLSVTKCPYCEPTVLCHTETAVLNLFSEPKICYNTFQPNISKNCVLHAFVFNSESLLMNQCGFYFLSPFFFIFKASSVHLWSTLSAEHMRYFLLFTEKNTNHFVLWN